MTDADFSESGLSETTFCPGVNFSVPSLRSDYPVRSRLIHWQSDAEHEFLGCQFSETSL